MSALPGSMIYTQDGELLQRIRGYLHARSEVRHVNDPDSLEMLLRQNAATILFVDLCAAGASSLLARLRREFPETLLIAIGSARSDPGLRAAAAEIYAIEPVNVDRLRLQSLFAQAQSHLRLQEENRILRERARPEPVAAEPAAESSSFNASLHHFSGAFRRFDNLGIMLESIVEGVASCTRIARVALFAITHEGPYSFRAGVKCLPDTPDLDYTPAHPFVQWLQLHAHSISRSMLRHIEAIDERVLLERTLDETGAEAILPLFGRRRLIGWLCLGRSASGAPLRARDIEELMQLAEQISVTIENSLLHENIAIEKAMAENLLQAIPVGIIAIGPDGAIRWFSRSAETLLNVLAEDHIGLPAERLSSTVASLLHRCMQGEKNIGAVEWTEPLTRRDLSIQVRRLQQNERCMGAMAILTDLTEERILREKQNNLERAAFWNELASAISHEVRNPLVAISTFAQLLPERYTDEEFRSQFRDLTLQEVTRLNSMIDQLDEYANPPTLRFTEAEAGELFDAVLAKLSRTDDVSVDLEVDIQPGVPALKGDVAVLADAIIHLVRNAAAAVKNTARPGIVLFAAPGEIGSARPAVVLEVRDNGAGIPEEIRDKVFSPFCTTKARGVGLGLPIVRRTMIDHGGLVAIEHRDPGTVVRLTLPAAEDEGDTA